MIYNLDKSAILPENMVKGGASPFRSKFTTLKPLNGKNSKVLSKLPNALTTPPKQAPTIETKELQNETKTIEIPSQFSIPKKNLFYSPRLKLAEKKYKSQPIKSAILLPYFLLHFRY